MRSAALALVLSALVVAGCGGGDDGHRRAVVPVMTPSPTLALTSCDDWAELRPASRMAFVEQLRIFVGGKVNAQYGSGHAIPDDKALALLSNLCDRPASGAVKLYKLYGRAAAFTAP